MYFTPGEQRRYDAEQATYAERHGACQAVRHTVQGSLTTHCGRCCPSPPLSPQQARDIASLLASSSKDRKPEDLMRWRLRLYCGHVVERSAHRSHLFAERAFPPARCPECGLDPATIVDAEPLGLVGQPPAPPRPDRAPPASRPTRAALEQRIRDLEAELASLRNNRDTSDRDPADPGYDDGDNGE